MLKNYNKLCLFTHISSFTRCSECELFPSFDATEEQMLAITAKYAYDSYFALRNEKFLDEKNIKKLDDIFSDLSILLLPILKKLI